MANRVKVDEKNEKIIRGLLKLPENRRCINCNILGPQYVCITFSTFVCTTCGGIHREFTHRVKSVSMANFTPQEITSLQAGGNERAKEIYFKDWDPHHQSAPDSSNVDRLRDFIKHVYVDRRYSGEKGSDRRPRGKLGDKEESNENRRSDAYRSGSRSPPYDDRYERRYSDRSSPGYDVRKSPGYDQDNQRHSDYGRSPVRPGIISDWRREDRFSDGRKSDDRRSSDGEGKPEIRSLDCQKDPSVPSFPAVRPVGEILGENVVPLRISEPPRASNSRVTDGSKFTQRTASSSSLASSNGNPVELKREASLIDFDAEPEPPVTAAAAQAQQSTAVAAQAHRPTATAAQAHQPTAAAAQAHQLTAAAAQAHQPTAAATQPQLLTAGQFVAQSTDKQSDDNWACFDSVPVEKVSQAPQSTNLLESMLRELSVPVPGHSSGSTNSIATSMPSNGVFPSSTSGDLLFSSGGSTAVAAFHGAAPASTPVTNLSSLSSGGVVAAPGLPPTLSTNGGIHQQSGMQYNQQGFAHFAASQGLTSNSVPRPSQDVMVIQSQTVEVKSNDRKELPANLFTAMYSFAPYQAPGWRPGVSGMFPGMGYPMQYNPAMSMPTFPQPTFPQSTKSANPFDANPDGSSAQAAALPSMSSLHTALPNATAPRGVPDASNLGTATPSWMPTQLSTMPPVAQSFGSAMPGTYMGQQLPTNMMAAGAQGYGNPGGEGPAFGSLNPPAAMSNPSLGGNPFG